MLHICQIDEFLETKIYHKLCVPREYCVMVFIDFFNILPLSADILRAGFMQYV